MSACAQRTESGRPEHWHAGSGGSFFAVVSIYPEDNLAIVVLTNYGLPGESPVFGMMVALYQRRSDFRSEGAGPS
jgi:hypothetical protein